MNKYILLDWLAQYGILDWGDLFIFIFLILIPLFIGYAFTFTVWVLIWHRREKSLEESIDLNIKKILKRYRREL